eukprot:4272473-Pyramimonas_sp.AAC.1
MLQRLQWVGRCLDDIHRSASNSLTGTSWYPKNARRSTDWKMCLEDIMGEVGIESLSSSQRDAILPMS